MDEDRLSRGWMPDSEPDAIWHSSPLKQDAVARVMAAPGLPIEGDETEVAALHLTLARLSVWIIIQAATPYSIPASTAQKIAESFETFVNLTAPSVGAANGPPPFPQDWARAMLAWANRTTAEENRQRGAPAKEFDRFAYPKLLAFYNLAYGALPGSTLNGPAHRFLSAYMGELNAIAKATTTEPPDMHERMLKRLAMPTPDAFRSRIRLFAIPSADDALWVKKSFELCHLKLQLAQVTETPSIH